MARVHRRRLLAACALACAFGSAPAQTSNLALNPGLYPNLPYDSVRDFEPVGLLVSYSYTLVARKDLPFDSLQEVLAHARGGRRNAKALAVSGAARNAMHPQVPTVQETGAAQLELESWFGLFAPAKTPPEVLQKLRADFAKVAAAPDVQESLARSGGKPMRWWATMRAAWSGATSTGGPGW